jgi:NitT/TauT family transport system permease protein/putative hydroxymethylpyrimidine transport system permease protein
MRLRGAGVLLPALTLAVVLGIWELYVDLGGADSLVLPPPHQIAAALYNDRGDLWSNFLVTAQEIVYGIAVGAVAALAIATVIHFSPLARRAVYPLLVASQAIPIPLIAPVLVFWLGFGLLPKLVVIALVSFFPLVVTTLAALQAVDPNLIKLMRTFDATTVQIFRTIEVPAALPGLFIGAKLATLFSVLGAVLAEQEGSTSGLGYLLTVTKSNLEFPEAYAAVAILAAFAIALFGLLTLVERRALPWAYHQRR